MGSFCQQQRDPSVKHPILLDPADKVPGSVDLHKKDKDWRKGYSQRRAAKEAGYAQLRRELRQTTPWGRLAVWLEDCGAALRRLFSWEDRP